MGGTSDWWWCGEEESPKDGRANASEGAMDAVSAATMAVVAVTSFMVCLIVCCDLASVFDYGDDFVCCCCCRYC